MIKTIKDWCRSAAGHISIPLIIISIGLIALATSSYPEI